MFEFGRFLIALFGYGLGILLMIGALKALVDIHAASTSPGGKSSDGMTKEENTESFLQLAAASIVLIIATMIILWLSA